MSQPAGLDVAATVTARDIDVHFRVPAGQVVALVGANGAGKSTALHAVAGLVHCDRATIRVGARTVTDTAAGVFVAAHARRVGMLLQDALLFPHLTATANVAFAARTRRRGRAAARRDAATWLEEVGATAYAQRRPRQLSGGQAQRVAVARALAAQPDALLLDEPLAGLDVTAAAALRTVLRRVLTQGGRCALLVTHDLIDVLSLADRVVVLEAGRVAEEGLTAAVLAAPRSAFAARLAGVNFFDGVAGDDATVRTGDGRRWYGTGERLPVGQPAAALFAPSAVAVHPDAPRGSPRNVLAVTITALEPAGSAIRVRGDDGTATLMADVTAAAVAELGLDVGRRVYFAVKAQEVTLVARKPAAPPTAPDQPTD